MRTITLSAGAGSTTKFHEIGKYFHILETVSAVDVRFFKNGAIFAEAVGMEAGFYSQPRDGFDAIEISSAGAQDIKFALSDGTGGYNRTTGSVQITGQQGAFTQAAETVTNVSGMLLAANTTRRMLLIQNNHATGIIYITTDGSAATTGHGIKVWPGGLIMLDVFCPTGEIYAIGDIASNASVVVIEG